MLSHQPTTDATEPTAVQKYIKLGCLGLLSNVMVKDVMNIVVEFFSLSIVSAAVENEVFYVFLWVTA